MSKLENFLTKNEITSLQSLQKAINENQITVNCVGLYNHGKSTLLNVLIKDFEYKTFKTADTRETTLNKSVIYNEIKYVDTPGLNAQEDDDKKVMEAIQSSDITLFVHTITTGEFNKQEIEFLDSVKQYWGNPQEFIERTIFVLSRIDNIENSEDIEKTSKRMKEQIKAIFNINCMICPVSAIDYADGMVENEEELIFESNIRKLEEKINFLSKQFKEAIIKTKRERFEKKVSELQSRLNTKLKSNQEKIKRLRDEQTKKDTEFKEDISKIENILTSFYSRYEYNITLGSVNSLWGSYRKQEAKEEKNSKKIQEYKDEQSLKIKVKYNKSVQFNNRGFLGGEPYIKTELLHQDKTMKNKITSLQEATQELKETLAKLEDIKHETFNRNIITKLTNDDFNLVIFGPKYTDSKEFCKKSNKIEAFYHALKDISIVNNNLQAKRDLLKKYVYDYNENIQTIKIDKTLEEQNKDIRKLLNSTLNILKSSSKKWVENFDKLLEKEKFRSDLENYFIIIIFGKVKAGKSSLGNFIAQNRPQNENVSFFKYDEAGKEQTIQKLEEIDDDSFSTNNLECTVEIQGFKLNSMAWIDTPGLGSMVEENGELAKEYIQSADYVIYPTSSDSPLQADEISQLKELFEQNKKVTICITKSDKFERRKDNNGKYIKENGKIAKFLVNKSVDDRIKQEDYVRNEIAKINKNQSLLGDIISMSAHTAKLCLENKDKELFENSNIPKFYELITEVVKEKASKLKSETPFNGLKSFIDNDVLGVNDTPLTIKIIREEIDNLDNTIDETLDSFNTLIENIKSDISREVEAIVAQYYIKINRHNSEEIFQNMDKAIADKISEIIEENIKDAFENFSYALDNLATSISGDKFKIKDVYEEYSYTTEDRNKNIGSALLGLGATIGAGLLTGGGAWVVAGASILAGGAGGYIGGKIGEMTGSKHTKSEKVGDNKDEVIQKFKEMQMNIHNNNTKKVYIKFKDSFFIPLQDKIKDIRLELDKFEENINSLKKELS